jgi:uncharacterized membrane protein YadS
MIIPVYIFFTIIMALEKKKEEAKNQHVNFNFLKIFPWFILFFIAASMVNSLPL